MNRCDCKLANPPIVEMVLDIDCALPPGQEIVRLEAPATEVFRDRYPKSRKRSFRQITVPLGPAEQVQVGGREGVEAYQFLHQDEKQVVQVRVGGFSFNRLAPYTSLDDYLSEIERTWNIYVDLAGPTEVRLIRLRYINRIPVPLSEGRVNLDDYFTIGPRVPDDPDEKTLDLIGFLVQTASVDMETGCRVDTVLASQKPEAEILPVIFDNCVALAENGNPQHWGWILGKISILRNLKNRVFRKAVTEKCLELFK